MVEVIIVGAAAAALLLWLLTRGRQLNKVFSEAHLIEIAERMGPVTRSAAEKAEASFDSESDPRILATSAGIVIVYTISPGDHVFTHHYSLKDQYGITTHAVGGTLSLYIARLLGITLGVLALQCSEQHVYHAEFDLSEAQQSDFLNRPVPIPTPQEAKALFGECLAARAEVEFVPLPSQDAL